MLGRWASRLSPPRHMARCAAWSPAPLPVPSPLPPPRRCALPPLPPRITERCDAWPPGLSARALPPLPTRNAHRHFRPLPHRPRPVPSPGPFAIRSRCGRARCPHRAAAPHGAVRGFGSSPPHRAIARTPLCAPHITPAHYPSGAMLGRRGSRLAPYRHYTRALPERRDGDIAPYRHYPRGMRTAIFAPWSRPLARVPRPVPSPGPFAIRSRCGRTRCLAAGPPGSRPPHHPRITRAAR